MLDLFEVTEQEQNLVCLGNPIPVSNDELKSRDRGRELTMTKGMAALCLLGLVAGASAGCVIDGDITCYTDVQSRILDPNNVRVCVCASVVVNSVVGTESAPLPSLCKGSFEAGC
jgi:hypothetical protein